MATSPNYAGTPNVSWNANNITAANTTRDGTTGTPELIWTAGASGGKLFRAKIRPRGTNVATVMRFFLNNGGALGTAANNILVGEVTLPATTTTEIAALAPVDFVSFDDIPANYRLYVTIGTAVVAGFSVTAYGANN